MKTARLLATTAATLLFTAGAASAQSLKQDQSPGASSPPAAQQRAPAEKVAPPMHSGSKAGDEKAGMKPSETTGQAPKSSDMDNRPPAASKRSADPNGNVEMKGDAGRATSGQGAASSSAKLSTEQRSKITTIIKQQKVAPAKLNVSASVGARVPPSVRLYPLPVEVVTIYPEWRGYEYILVGDEILVINPRTHEIVAILEA